MTRCKACDLELDAGAERCPKCLRKSLVIKTPAGRVVHVVFGFGEPPT